MHANGGDVKVKDVLVFVIIVAVNIIVMIIIIVPIIHDILVFLVTRAGS